MRREIIFFGSMMGVVIIILLLPYCLCHVPNKKVINEEYTKYECDVKVLNLNTKIIISKENEEIAYVSGNILKLIEDPLTMYDSNKLKKGYAGDTYHFVSQDSHGIYADNEFKCDMVGKVDILGESYEIYDKDEKLIAKMKFNEIGTAGIMYDSEDNLLAEYNSPYFYKDFSVRIYSNCALDEKTVLMLFCSYYSDYSADHK